MFPIAQDDVLEVRVFAAADGQAINNRLDYRMEDLAVGASNSQEFLTAFRDDVWRPEILTNVCDTLAVIRYEVVRILGAILVVGSDNKKHYVRQYDVVIDELPGVSGTDVGAVITASLPTYATVTMQKHTGFRTRTRRGSIRIAPIAEADSVPAGNALEPVELAAWQAVADNMADTFQFPLVPTFGAVPSLFAAKDFVEGTGGATVVSNTFPITTFLVNELLGSQLSRKAKVGAR